MKKYFITCVVLLIVLSLIGCNSKISQDDIDTYANKIAALEQEVNELKNEAEQSSAQQAAEATTPASTIAPSPPPTFTPSGMSDTPQGNPRMFSSYAHMINYDPARGWADFDYFEMYTGPEAIDALVDYEGYTLADAQAEVNNYAEGEFYEKNTNPQLRTIDLKTTEVVLLVNPDGTVIGDIANPPSATVLDVFNIYNANPNYLYDIFFYFITVDNVGNITKVEQIYRP